ncbi:hypothetical protein [Saccharothrix australiensis]|uniref:PknH-like protein n=1 Tax=Saccharothrix australiensis TaxID=2072 RepID=A0A495W2P6_9PSEU|nr:hypothetical protein [Saccharothrix australiensis]RKT55307.1 hypothetical protein C8E97_3970 [Saccharothrix australiensis]
MKIMGGLAAVCVAAGVLTACGGPAPAAEPAPSSTAPTTTSTAPSTTSSTPSPADRLPALVERAAIPRDGMADRGIAEPTDQRYASAVMPRPCAAEVEAESGYTPALFRVWDGEQGSVRQTVIGYSEATGAEVLSQLAAASRGCTSWSDQGRQVRVVEGAAVNRPEGVEGFLGYCASVTEAEQLYWMCVAFVARGNLVSCVFAFRGDVPSGALDDLHAILPRAVDRLVNA